MTDTVWMVRMLAWCRMAQKQGSSEARHIADFVADFLDDTDESVDVYGRDSELLSVFDELAGWCGFGHAILARGNGEDCMNLPPRHIEFGVLHDNSTWSHEICDVPGIDADRWDAAVSWYMLDGPGGCRKDVIAATVLAVFRLGEDAEEDAEEDTGHEPENNS